MAFSAALTLRSFIDIVQNLLFEQQEEWSVSKTDIFDETLRENLRIFPDLNEKLIKFIDVKAGNPLQSRYGKHDRPFTGDVLKGFHHCHLRDDAILIYKLERRTIVLVAIVSHAEIEGKRMQRTAKRLAPYNPRNR